MTGPEIDLLAIRRGIVQAPAGCGKTELVANALARYDNAKPVLVLTHTNAGVASLRARLGKAGVRHGAFRLATIDGWVMQLASTFPYRSGLDPQRLDLADPARDYPEIRRATAHLLNAGHVNDIVTATYSRLVVDEYQDCSARQHQILSTLAELIPVCGLGDPLQAIFDFGRDRLPPWESVIEFYGLAGVLDTPWRWVNQGTDELGEWLFDVRRRLLAGEAIDLREAPDEVAWVELGGDADHKRLLDAARVEPAGPRGRVLIIGDQFSAEHRGKVASQTPGAVAVEAVDLRDLVAFAAEFDPHEPNAVVKLVGFAARVLSNIGAADFLKRLEILQRGTARKEATDTEDVGLRFVANPSYGTALDLLIALQRQGGVRVYRPDVLRACIDALRCADCGECFLDAVLRFRERFRHAGRVVPRRAVGSTLLLKGLEAETVVIHNAHQLTAKHLYVALSRGSRAIVVCSTSPVLRPT